MTILADILGFACALACIDMRVHWPPTRRPWWAAVGSAAIGGIAIGLVTL